MTKYKWKQDTEQWECGDGCCSGSNTTIWVNDLEVGTYGDLYLRSFESFETFIQLLNKNEGELVLSYSAKVDEGDHLSDVILLNDVFITDSVWASQIFPDTLHALKLPFTEITYDLDWDLWDKKKELSLLVESEEKHPPT